MNELCFFCICLTCLQQVKHEYSLVKNNLETLFKEVFIGQVEVVIYKDRSTEGNSSPEGKKSIKSSVCASASDTKPSLSKMCFRYLEMSTIQSESLYAVNVETHFGGLFPVVSMYFLWV